MAKQVFNNYTYGYIVNAQRFDLRDKDACARYYVRKWLTELQSMLAFDGLPETIPERDFKRLLQINGFAFLPDPATLPDGKPYAFYAGLGGEPDPYYMPTLAVVSNPALKLSATYRIHDDGVLVRHDSYMTGLIPMLNHYATMTVDADLSLYIASILSRAPVHISAQGDRTKASADEYINDLEKGKLGSIYESGFLDGIKTNPGSASTSNQSITNLIEYRQYLKASRWNDCGLNANYNMKRESINESEAQMNNDALTPFTDDIITSIQSGLDEFNEKYGFNITVRLSGAWAVKEVLRDVAIEQAEQAQNDEFVPNSDNEPSKPEPEVQS